MEMVSGVSEEVSGDAIRGTDIPTEYIFVFAFFFIVAIGAFVGFQIKKARSALPIASGKRLDWAFTIHEVLTSIS